MKCTYPQIDLDERCKIDRRDRLERHPLSVSHETIYKFAYSPDGHAWWHLPGQRRARRRPSDAVGVKAPSRRPCRITRALV